MRKSLRLKPSVCAVVTGKWGERKDWPAFRANNDRFLCTVPVLSGDPTVDCQHIKRLHVTHQPTGLVATYDVPYKLALIVADAYFALLGDHEDAETVCSNFGKLSPAIRQWLRHPISEIPKQIGDIVKLVKKPAQSKAARTSPAPVMKEPVSTKINPSVLVETPVSGVLSPEEFRRSLKSLEFDLGLIAERWSARANRTNSECETKTLRPTRLN